MRKVVRRRDGIGRTRGAPRAAYVGRARDCAKFDRPADLAA